MILVAVEDKMGLMFMKPLKEEKEENRYAYDFPSPLILYWIAMFSSLKPWFVWFGYCKLYLQCCLGLFLCCQNISRVQLTEDELIAYFLSFDGK